MICDDMYMIYVDICRHIHMHIIPLLGDLAAQRSWTFSKGATKGIPTSSDGLGSGESR